MSDPQRERPAIPSPENGTEARRILARMGEIGQPPERGALRVNVGTTELLEVLRREYLIPIRESGLNSSFKLVSAPFGGGKTHFLRCLQETAWQEGFVCALVGLSPKECPFDDTAKIYQAVAQALERPPLRHRESGRSITDRESGRSISYSDSDTGLDAVLRAEIERRLRAHTADEVREWIREEFLRARVESHAIRRAAAAFMEALIDRDPAREALFASYLRGESVQLSELQPHGIREVLDGSSAFRFLRSLVQVLRALGVPGLVLLFDELDRVMSLSLRRRRAIGDNLRAMIDHCGQSTLPALLWVYAVPPEFMTTIVPEYPALEQRLRGLSRFTVTSPLSPLIDLDHLSLGPVEMLKQIGVKLLELHQEAYGGRLDPKIQRANLAALATELGEGQLETGNRRTFVKAAVQILGEQERGGERKLGREDIRALVAGRRAEPAVKALPDEEVF